INLSNFLLVTGRSGTGDPEGVAPDMAAEIANRLGVPVKYVPYKTPGELADAADTLSVPSRNAPRKSPSRPPIARSRRPTSFRMLCSGGPLPMSTNRVCALL